MQMNRAEIDVFLDAPRTMVVATIGRNGMSQLSTVWYRWDGEAAWIATNRDRAKYRNLQRDPRVSLLVDDPPAETSVVLYGRAEFVAMDDDAQDGALAIVRRYVDDAGAYLELRPGEPRVLIRIVPRRIVTWQRELD